MSRSRRWTSLGAVSRLAHRLQYGPWQDFDNRNAIPSLHWTERRVPVVEAAANSETSPEYIRAVRALRAACMRAEAIRLVAGLEFREHSFMRVVAEDPVLEAEEPVLARELLAYVCGFVTGELRERERQDSCRYQELRTGPFTWKGGR